VPPSDSLFWLPPGRLRSNFVAARLAETEIAPNGFGIRRMSVQMSLGSAESGERIIPPMSDWSQGTRPIPA
jgi:hypothetical protein